MSEPATTGGAIYRAIPAIMAEVGHIAKGRQATEGGPRYKYRGVDDFYAALQPLLAKHGVFVAPHVLEQKREERPTKAGGVMTYTILSVRFVFWAADGSSVECVTVGEAMDTSDKSSNKAMSAAMKYAFILTFSIPTDDPEQDTESGHNEPAPRMPQQHRPPPSGPAAQPPGREPGSDDGDDERLVAGIDKARTMTELRALVGLRDKVTGKNTQHALWAKFVAKYRQLDAAERGQNGKAA